MGCAEPRRVDRVLSKANHLVPNMVYLTSGVKDAEGRRNGRQAPFTKVTPLSQSLPAADGWRADALNSLELG